MVGKIKHPQIETEESIKRIRKTHEELDAIEVRKREVKAKIEKISNVSYLMIILKLARKEEEIQKAIIQLAVIERLKELDVLKGTIAKDIEKLTGLKIFL